MERDPLFSLFEPELRQGEMLVWADRPSPRARAMARLKISFMGVLLTAFASF